MAYTHDGAGIDGKPAVIFDPDYETWSIEEEPHRPLTPADFTLVKDAIAAMEAHIAGVTKALAECSQQA